jgi:hypothetical protein
MSKIIKNNVQNVDIQLTNTHNELNFLIAKAERLGFVVKVDVRKNKMLHTVVDVSWSFP